jgi:hypothetical protein
MTVCDTSDWIYDGCAKGLMPFKPWTGAPGAGEIEHDDTKGDSATFHKAGTHKTRNADMEVAGCLIFASRLIDTVLRNNLWQFKKVRSR